MHAQQSFLNVRNTAILEYHGDNIILYKNVKKSQVVKLLNIEELSKLFPTCTFYFFRYLCLMQNLQQHIYNMGTGGHCYKTFCRGNLLSFRGNTIILCYKAILPL